MESKEMDTSESSQKNGTSGVNGLGGKYLTFFLSEEAYGIEILKVHEIIGWHPITRVPHTPDYLKGVINLRGKVIPIVDARLKFGMSSVESTNETCIIVVSINGLKVGVIVDKVSEVINIPDEETEPAPSFGTACSTDYIMGIGKAQGRVTILLDIERVMLSNEFSNFEEIGAGTDKISA